VPTLSEQWLDWLKVERNRSDNTISTYARTMKTLGDHPERMTREGVEQWWRERAEGSVSTRNNELSAVRGFFRWLARFEHREDDPTIRLDLLTRPRRVSRFVGRDDLAHLLDTLPADLRRAVALGAYAGLRVSEAASLHWRDVEHESRRLIVRGKGDNDRRVGLSATLLDQLLPEGGGYVVTGRAETMSAHTLQQRVNAAIKAAGVDATFHKLRHRYGFKSAEAGIKPTAIANAMGHASLQTTMGYIAATDTDLDLIAEAVTR